MLHDCFFLPPPSALLLGIPSSPRSLHIIHYFLRLSRASGLLRKATYRTRSVRGRSPSSLLRKATNRTRSVRRRSFRGRAPSSLFLFILRSNPCRLSVLLGHIELRKPRSLRLFQLGKTICGRRTHRGRSRLLRGRAPPFPLTPPLLILFGNPCLLSPLCRDIQLFKPGPLRLLFRKASNGRRRVGICAYLCRRIAFRRETRAPLLLLILLGEPCFLGAFFV
mmetsp:Transcript_77105/g.121765  ORF Transcript_77105/g.121765 Transcript_77105/m.121765 type:complete len:222 (-) Transcript_77105:331-996(-)